MKTWMVISTMKGKVMILPWIGQETMTGLEKMLPCLKSHISHKQIELFQYRYENGYDLYTDTDYVTWLMG